MRAFPGASIHGVDTSQSAVAHAQRHFGSAQITFGLVQELTAIEQFDLCYVNGVFHHIEPSERPTTLQFIRRALRPNGIFALWENNPWNPGTRFVMSRIPFDRDAKLLTAREAVKLLHSMELTPLRVDHEFIFPRLLSTLRPLEPFLSAWPFGGQYQVLARR